MSLVSSGKDCSLERIVKGPPQRKQKPYTGLSCKMFTFSAAFIFF